MAAFEGDLDDLLLRHDAVIDPQRFRTQVLGPRQGDELAGQAQQRRSPRTETTNSWPIARSIRASRRPIWRMLQVRSSPGTSRDEDRKRIPSAETSVVTA